MRIVGSMNRSEYVLDPQEAWERGRRIDALGKSFSIPHPPGVSRGKHAFFNALDDQRSVEMARRLNTTPSRR